MASPPELIPPPLSVDDILAFSDAELADFMQENRRPHGGYELPVDGWEKLSSVQRKRLVRRLKAQEQALALSPSACSRPLDLDELDARLRNVSDRHKTAWQTQRQENARSRITPPIDLEARARDRETEAYHDLLKDGGRPLYPIHLLDCVLKDPEEYRETLRFWQHPRDPDSRSLFRRQLQRWQDFRKWQRDNRGLDDDDGSFAAYVEWIKHEDAKDYTEAGYAKRLAEIETDPSCLRSEWDLQRAERERQRSSCREHDCDGFPDYGKAVKRRLARHNFTRPFQLMQDPKQQDTLTTWIEYLNFECWWFDLYTETVDRLKPHHDKAWQELVDSKVLRPHETKEFIRTDTSSRQDQAEEDQAWKAVERANLEAGKVYRLTQNDPKRSRIPKKKRILMLTAATARLNAAKDRLQSVKRRNNLILSFVRGTFDYEDAKKDAARHNTLLRWVLEQVPLIEAEMIQSEANEAGPGRTKRGKRGFTTEDHGGKRGSKRQKLEHQRLDSLNSTAVLAEARETRTERYVGIAQNEVQGSQGETSPAERAVRPVDASLVTFQGPRRSARIAARGNTSETALTPQTCQPGLHTRSLAKPREPPKSLADTRATATKKGLKSTARWGMSKPSGVLKRDRRPRRRPG
ncbi:hypothetical protein HIM_12584 [Hirsutella minnesotensis 3608]|uniref:Ankyrin 2,3/unc44 n=1 Tax=Hirsutella minnesotensis 3608 TaxID=1043627 RepID=A0A0F7ZHV0_9HYPO|nr:hypothetical protein HIM_12584 [Hirsutella minnesotensis 3608]